MQNNNETPTELDYDSQFKPEGKTCETCSFATCPTDSEDACGYHYNRLNFGKDASHLHEKSDDAPEPVSPLEEILKSLSHGEDLPDDVHKSLKIVLQTKDGERKLLSKYYEAMFAQDKSKYWAKEIRNTTVDLEITVDRGANTCVKFGLPTAAAFNLREASNYMKAAVAVLNDFMEKPKD